MLQFMRRLQIAVPPQSGLSERERGLQETLDRLHVVIGFAILMTGIWAIAAGVLQTGRLVQYIPNGFPGNGSYWSQTVNWLAPVVAVPVYAFKAFAVALLVGVAAMMTGGFFGFLFGIPSVAVPTGTAPPGQAASTAAPAAAASPPSGTPAIPATSAGPVPEPGSAFATPNAAASGRTWQTSTHLTEISEWLTKLLVGAGLVEAKAALSSLWTLSKTLGDMLFGGAISSQLVITALLVSGTITGFLYIYLFTLLKVAGLMARSDAELNAPAIAAPQAIVPRSLQERKQEFSDYIQQCVKDGNTTDLDQIAQRLQVAVGTELQEKRRNILAEVGKRVNVSDPIEAARRMDELSALLEPITGSKF